MSDIQEMLRSVLDAERRAEEITSGSDREANAVVAAAERDSRQRIAKVKEEIKNALAAYGEETEKAAEAHYESILSDGAGRAEARVSAAKLKEAEDLVFKEYIARYVGRKG